MLCRGVQLCRVLLTWHHRGPRSEIPGRIDTERSVAGQESIGRASGLALALVCLGGPAPAAERSVRDLYEDCTGRDAHADASFDHDGYHDLLDALCNTYEAEWYGAFERESARAARYLLTGEDQ